MSKGELPTQYIVALILAIIVIGVLAYMFFTHTGIFSGTASKEYCEAKRLRYCFDWKQSGSEPEGGWSSYAPGCTELGVTVNKEECSKLGVQISEK